MYNWSPCTWSGRKITTKPSFLHRNSHVNNITENDLTKKTEIFVKIFATFFFVIIWNKFKIFFFKTLQEIRLCGRKWNFHEHFLEIFGDYMYEIPLKKNAIFENCALTKLNVRSILSWHSCAESWALWQSSFHSRYRVTSYTWPCVSDTL